MTPRLTSVPDPQTETFTSTIGYTAPAANVIEAICRVKADLPGIGKGEQAPGAMGGYMYRGIEQLTAVLQDLTARHGIVVVPDGVTETVVNEFTTKGGAVNTDTRIHFRWKVYGPGGITDFICGENVGIGRDNFDKGASKAGTQAFKEFLIKLFCIGDKSTDPDGQDSDERQSTHSDTPDGRIIGSGQPPRIDWQALGWVAGPVNSDADAAEAIQRHDDTMKSIAADMADLSDEQRKQLLEQRRNMLGPLPLSFAAAESWALMVAAALTTTDPPDSVLAPTDEEPF